MNYRTYMSTNVVLLFYTTYISVYLAHHEISHAKLVGKGGKMKDMQKLEMVIIFRFHSLNRKAFYNKNTNIYDNNNKNANDIEMTKRKL